MSAAGPHTLLIGVGNPLRGDDAVGWLAAEALEAARLPGVEVLATQQLTVELVERMALFARVVIVDAAVDQPQVTLAHVEAGPAAAGSSHELSPAALVALGQQLYGRVPAVWVCGIPARDFTLGAPVTAKAQAELTEAVRRLRRWLTAS